MVTAGFIQQLAETTIKKIMEKNLDKKVNY